MSSFEDFAAQGDPDIGLDGLVFGGVPPEGEPVLGGVDLVRYGDLYEFIWQEDVDGVAVPTLRYAPYPSSVMRFDMEAPYYAKREVRAEFNVVPKRLDLRPFVATLEDGANEVMTSHLGHIYYGMEVVV